jgi:hypothetical protein
VFAVLRDVVCEVCVSIRGMKKRVLGGSWCCDEMERDARRLAVVGD